MYQSRLQARITGLTGVVFSVVDATQPHGALCLPLMGTAVLLFSKETEMPVRPFTIFFSKYSSRLFAWAGTPEENTRHLGVRPALGIVHATCEADALVAWQARTA